MNSNAITVYCCAFYGMIVRSPNINDAFFIDVMRIWAMLLLGIYQSLSCHLN